MELPISIPCPNCSVKLKIKDAALFGRSLKCPKCGERFTPGAPAEPEDEGHGIAEEAALPPGRGFHAPAVLLLLADEYQSTTYIGRIPTGARQVQDSAPLLTRR
jgi:hypothetical protein